MTNTTPLDVREVTVPSALLLELDVAVGEGPSAMAAAMETAFGTLMTGIARHTLTVTGAPRAVYQSWNNTSMQFTAAIPIAERPKGQLLGDGLKVVRIPAMNAMRFEHDGPYRNLRDTYQQIDIWLHEKGVVTTEEDWAQYRGMWEEYVGDPITTPESDLITRIYLPLR